MFNHGYMMDKRGEVLEVNNNNNQQLTWFIDISGHERQIP